MNKPNEGIGATVRAVLTDKGDSCARHNSRRREGEECACADGEDREAPGYIAFKFKYLIIKIWKITYTKERRGKKLNTAKVVKNV